MSALIKNKKEIKTPLRYPGGKSKAVRIINPIIPNDFSEFREPFVGGGSVFIDAKQNINPRSVYKINDIKCLQELLALCSKNARSLFERLNKTLSIPPAYKQISLF